MQPEQKLAFIEQASIAMETGRPVPIEAAEWIGAALRAYLSGKCLDITASLGLRPRRGGAFETPRALVRRRERDALICLVAARVPATTAKAKSEACQQLLCGEARLDDFELAKAVAKLRAEFSSELPSSARQYLRILSGEGIHYRR